MANRVDLTGPSFAPLYASARSAGHPEIPDWFDRADLSPEQLTQPLPGQLSEHGWTSWTDVLIDFRTPDARTPLPATVTGAQPGMAAGSLREWASDAPGWSLTGWAVAPEQGQHAEPEAGQSEQKVDGYSVARFTDPEGFRFALVVSHDRPGKTTLDFASGRFSFLLPTMRFVFVTEKDSSRQRAVTRTVGGLSESGDRGDMGVALSLEGFFNQSQTYSLPALRDAVRDPAGWFGTAGTAVDWRDLEFRGPFRPITPARALLAWAAGGAASFTEVEDWVHGGLDAAEAAAWQEFLPDSQPGSDPGSDRSDPEGVSQRSPAPACAPTGAPAGRTGTGADPVRPWTDADILNWFAGFGGGRRRRQDAALYYGAGFTPARAARWQHVQGALYELASVEVVEAAGWTPEEMATVMAAQADERRASGRARTPGGLRFPTTPRSTTPVADAAQWTFTTPGRARGFLGAGFSAAEARQLEGTNESPSEDTLVVLAALRTQ